jgi:hypothetical protein
LSALLLAIRAVGHQFVALSHSNMLMTTKMKSKTSTKKRHGHELQHDQLPCARKRNVMTRVFSFDQVVQALVAQYASSRRQLLNRLQFVQLDMTKQKRLLTC